MLVIDVLLNGTACYYTIPLNLVSEEVRRTITDTPEILVPLSQNYNGNDVTEHLYPLLGHVQRVGPTAKEADQGHDEKGVCYSWLSGPFDAVLMMVESQKSERV